MQGEVWKRSDVAEAFLTERSLVLPDRPRQIEVMLRVVRSFSPSPRRVLDLGAGDALLLAAVLEVFPDARGEAVDFSPLMLAQARRRLAVQGGRARVVQADLRSPDWRRLISGPYDAVISGFAIHHLPDDRKRTLYEEIFDLLPAGGAFVNCENVSSPTARVERLFEDAMSEHLWNRRRENGESPTLEEVHDAFVNRPDHADDIPAPLEDQCRWLREIGFQDVDCFWKYFNLAIFGGRR